MAKVFIGVPTFNRADLVREAVASIRAQSFTDWQALVSDNCSRPDVTAEVRAFVEGLGDTRVSFHAQAVNDGEYGQGWLFLERSAACEYMMMLHDDDVIAPDYLQAGVAALAGEPAADLYVANFVTIDPDGSRREDLTAARRRLLGRSAAPSGLFDVRTGHVMSGFTPICGTLFRRRAFEASGFVDRGKVGNYPFECDLFLRLGDIGAKGWFDPAERLSFRDHPKSQTSTLEYIDNPLVVQPMLEMFDRRRYSGADERRRRVLVSRFCRADAMIRLRQGDTAAARRLLWRAVRENPQSPQSWALSAAALLWPGMLRRSLPPVQTGGVYGERDAASQRGTDGAGA